MSDKDEKQDKVEEVKKDDNEEELARLAEQELLREAVQGAARVELVGPSGWVKPPSNKTNKKFLQNTIRNTIASNRYYHKKRLDNNYNRKPYNYHNYRGRRRSPERESDSKRRHY